MMMVFFGRGALLVCQNAILFFSPNPIEKRKIITNNENYAQNDEDKAKADRAKTKERKKLICMQLINV